MSIESAKKELREEMRSRRNSLSPAERERMSAAVAKNLDELISELSETKNIHVFLPILNEPDLTGLYTAWLKRGFLLQAPVVLDNRTMESRALTNVGNIQPGKLGTLEPVPVPAVEIKPDDPDVVLVPGVAFDEVGMRLGLGKGFYDRFLKESGAIRVGIAYAFQLVEKVPSGEADQRVDYLVTDAGIMRFDNNQ